jgi:hypothetical protein
MRRALPVLLAPAAAAVVALSGCGSSGTSSAKLVGLPAGEAACRLAKEGASYRMGTGPVVKPSREIACRPVDGPQPRVVRAVRRNGLVLLRANCDPTVGCL